MCKFISFIKGMAALIVCLLVSATASADDWWFDEDNIMSSGELNYAVDVNAKTARCVGLKEGSTATVITVPAKVTLSGTVYDVVSIGYAAFYETELTEVHLLSPSIELNDGAFPPTLQSLYLSAVEPPTVYELPFTTSYMSGNMLKVYVPEGCAEKYFASSEAWAFCVIIEGQEQALNVTLTKAGTLKDKVKTMAGGYQSVNNLKVSGPINASDITVMRDSMKMLLSVDLTDALCKTLPQNAFYNCKITSVKLPTCLEEIGRSAFSGCNYLGAVTVPEGVKKIGDSAFEMCNALRQMDFPSTLESMGDVFLGYVMDGTGDETVNVTFRGIMPPAFGEGYPFFAYGLMVKFQVPAIGLDNYTNSVLGRLGVIEPVDVLPQKMLVLRDLTLSTDNIPEGYHPEIVLTRENKGTYSYTPYAVLTLTGSKPMRASKVTIINNVGASKMLDYCTTSVLMTNGLLSADEVKMKIMTMSDEWAFLSFPFDVKVQDIVADSRIKHWVIRSYSSRNRAIGHWQQWIDVPANGVLKANQGYIWYVTLADDGEAHDIDVEMELTPDADAQAAILGNAEVSLPLGTYEAEFAHNDSWNFVGNPYPTYYNIQHLSLTMPVYVWDYEYRKYRVYSPIDDEMVLSPNEAFFVQKPKGGDVLTFPLSGRCTSNEVSNGYAKARTGADRRLIDLRMTVGESYDDARLVLNASASEQYEMGRDAAKMFSLVETVPQFYTLINDVPCAINERPEGNGAVALGMRMGEGGTATLSLQRGGGDALVLVDKATGTMTDLTTGSYTFTASAGECDDRFVLYFGDGATRIQTTTLSEGSTASDAYNLTGMRVGRDYRGIVVVNGKKHIRK